MKFSPDDFPRLREFARGYLHQDVVREYGSAEAAARAYLTDLNEEEGKEVAEESKRFVSVMQRCSPQEAHTALKMLGSAWQAASRQELMSCLSVLGT